MPTATDIRALIDRTQLYLPSDTLALIEDAYEFASETCLAGENSDALLEHSVQTAISVAELQLDENCVTAALLHAAAEVCGVGLDEMEERFGAEVRKLVEGLVKLGRISSPGELKHKKGTVDIESQAESMRKMLMALADDIRVVFIKLADQLEHMRNLKTVSPARRRDVAEETMQVYAPIAHRLGIWHIQSQLEDLALRYLEPKRFREIGRLIAAGREERQRYVAQVTKTIKDELTSAGIEADVSGRLKHTYSILKKMDRYAAQGKELSEIYDLLGFRILVNDLADCYEALGVIHSMWRPLPGEFNDYIANPRDGVYRAIHTTVMYRGTTPLEIQIRSHEMHRVAEYGLAAHWRYKEGAKVDSGFEEKISIMRQLLDWYKDVGGAEFLESMSADVFADTVLVYTPKGDIKELPAGSTPLDFAYRIHTDLGHRCIGAKVDGRMRPLNCQLQSGNVVEIVTTKTEKGPSRDWLNPAMGYLKTSHAKEKARQWFRRQEREENILRGKDLLEKELRRLGVSLSERDLAELFKRESVDEFLAAVGSGDLSTHQIAAKLTVQQDEPSAVPETVRQRPRAASAIQVMGVGDLLTHLAPCCSPVPGDDIIGYVTRAKGVSVHRRDCPNVANVEDKERLIEVEWGHTEEVCSVPLCVEAFDRVGLLRDISAVIADEKVNIATLDTVVHSDRTTSIHLTLQTQGIGQLSRILSKLEGVKGVVSVARHTQEVKLAK
ncbi:MAG: bifunctional (p)ppGpp synthetase/guanosine-3',5'-bis(diphosphate) 3'-pyrophosphohydrolase [Chloroflexota bacterium]|nr:bifunctional (p)ppGpp synthetase/guanosine-3',5'-bis(diphosphate) 3'-pyrophosphohydrolase [Chloroflexota bacterium]